MKYTVKYKHNNQLFWHTIKNVVGDSTFFLNDNTKLPYRVFFLEDNTRIEIPLEGVSFAFSKERFDAIKKNMEKESGHKIP
jgi:hypothetical protein